MADFPFPILIAVLFLFVCLAVLHLHQRQQNQRRALPLRADYFAAHGIETPVCVHCRSIDTRDVGLNDSTDHRRIVSCARCNRMLYRYERSAPDEAR